MLRTETVSPQLLGILRALMNSEQLLDLRLVGGTSLALQLGHRESIDIDLFGIIDFDFEHESILKSLGHTISLKRSKVINIFSVDNIKVDFVKYRYPWLDPCIEIDGIRMASPKDIAAMKFSAITNRGSKKDFVDLYYLLQIFSFDEIFQFYVDKYDDANPFLAKKSLMHFAEAEMETMPRIAEEISWLEIKNTIIEKFRKEGY